MNNFKRPVFTKMFYTTPRARTRIQCTNTKNNSNNPKEPIPSIKDALQVVSIATYVSLIFINTSAIYTCYFELCDELIELNYKVDKLVNDK